jgi:tRNA modification GTPase
MTNNTIFALSSAKGKSAIAVYRVSGSETLNLISSICRNNSPVPKKLYRSNIINPTNGQVIDDVMWVYFKSPNSYTGEDTLELYTHGSIAVGKALTESILSLDNIRYADPGEFTKRALINGKMDLTSAEGLIDLINSETEKQRCQAIKHMRGFLYEKIESWRQKIIKIMSLVEAYIDFPEENIPDEVILESEEIIKSLKNSFEKILNDERKGERLRNGIKMVIYGKPNVGKSSLINYLSDREVAIVSEISGTTRDIIETHLDIGGYPIILADTAGINTSTEDLIEIEGIKRAKKVIDESDIRIFMQSAEESNIEFIDDGKTINVINKIDKTTPNLSEGFISLSVKHRIGLDKLMKAIIDYSSKLTDSSEEIGITQERHRIAISKARDALDRLNLKSDLVLAAEDLRIASRQLSFMIGKIDSEEILGQIFSSFCIGK